MKKVVIIAAALIMGTGMLVAQSFKKGNHGINAGFGIGNPGSFGAGYAFRPSINASYELGIVEVPMGSELTGVVGVGGYLGWAPIKWSNSAWTDDSWYYTGNRIMLAARGTYHFIFHDKLDPYAGVLVGVNIETWKWHGDSQYPDDYAWDNSVGASGGVFVGARWFFTDQIAAYAELGYLISVVNFGVTFKIQ